MRKNSNIIYLSIICMIVIGLAGCGKDTSQIKNTNTEQTSNNKNSDVKKSKNQSNELKKNVKHFEKIDLSLVNSGEIIDVKAEASFAKRCQTIDEIYNNSTYIVQGKVIDTYFTVLDGLPYTVMDFETTDSIKGNLKKGDQYTILLYGGYMSIQQEVSYYNDASKFQNIAKNKWKNTFLEKRLTNAAYPSSGEEYVMCLLDNHLEKGTYVPVNEYETIFKKTSDGQYTRILPSKEYFGTEEKQPKACLNNNTSFEYQSFKYICKSLE